MTKNVLSIQSHVVFGHAGNSAAVFPMRRLGVNVWPLNTVQFSNHTQYGHWTGTAINAAQMEELAEGIGAIGMLPRCDAVLSGYLGTPEQAQSVLEIVKAVKAANPRAWYFCDPVMGAASGCKVEPGIQQFLVDTMPEVADAMAPNHTELQRLVGREIETLEEAVAACARSSRADRSSCWSNICSIATVPRIVSTCSSSPNARRGWASARSIRSRGSRSASAI